VGCPAGDEGLCAGAAAHLPARLRLCHARPNGRGLAPPHVTVRAKRGQLERGLRLQPAAVALTRHLVVEVRVPFALPQTASERRGNNLAKTSTSSSRPWLPHRLIELRGRALALSEEGTT